MNRNEPNKRDNNELHPAWRAFIKLCSDMGHGEIERLKVQDGLPVSAEKVVEKIKLT